jgi:drug/metabolite transporter (DMT)-like permease
MNWFFLALISALFLASSAIVEKRGLKKVHSVDFSAAVSLWGLVFSIPFLFFIDFSVFSPKVVIFIGASAFMAAAAFVLVAKGFRHLDISLVSPLLSLSPGVTAILGFLVLGEVLNIQHIVGVGCMIIGSYILAIDPNKTFLNSFREFRQSSYIQLVLFSLVFYSIGAVLDRIIVSDLSVSVPAYIFSFHIFIAIFSLVIASIFGNGLKGVGLGIVRGGASAVFVSILTIGYRFFQMEALQVAFVGLVSAVKRSSSFFTTLIGGGLFHEKHVGRRLFASVTIIIGAVLMVL